MKKTLTVNLNGVVFNIDEDAYQLLDNYLSNLRAHYSHEEGADEIMNDFEARISELLNERMRLGFNVITVEHVGEVIKRMGKPEDIFAEEEASKSSDSQSKEASEADNSLGKGQKRYMRDPDDKILGGVASGLAAYWGLDVTIVRLILLLFLFLPTRVPIVFIYLILWLVVPLATTAADKLIMRGESVNLENIGKTVTDGFDKAANQTNQFLHSEQTRTTLQKIGDFIVSFFGVILKIGAVLLAIVLVPVLLLIVFVLVVVIFALIAGGLGTIFSGIPFIGSDMQFVENVPEYIMAIGSISGIVFFGIPLVTLFYQLLKRPMKLKPMPNVVKWILLAIWLLSLIAVCAISVWSFKEFGEGSSTYYYQSLNLLQNVFSDDSWRCLVNK